MLNPCKKQRQINRCDLNNSPSKLFETFAETKFECTLGLPSATANDADVFRKVPSKNKFSFRKKIFWFCPDGQSCALKTMNFVPV